MIKDINGRTIKVGSHVIWYDPDLSCRDTERIWEVYEIQDEYMIRIADDYSEAKAYASELEVI